MPLRAGRARLDAELCSSSSDEVPEAAELSRRLDLGMGVDSGEVRQVGLVESHVLSAPRAPRLQVPSSAIDQDPWLPGERPHGRSLPRVRAAVVGSGHVAIPLSTYAFGLLGTLMLVRGLWNPHRAVVRKGALESCAGPRDGRCAQSVVLDSPPGTAVYAVSSGRVVSVGPTWVHLQVSNEPVIAAYYGIEPTVEVGEHVTRGRKIAEAVDPVQFEVWELVPMEGGVGLEPLEPSSWLTARGLKHAVKLTGGDDLWCGGQRRITVPKAAHEQCRLESPSPAGFALLPVSVEQE